jgi:hypothetical protein
MKKFFVCAVVAVVIALHSAALADEPRPFAHPDRIHYDGHCLTIDGKDVFLFSGSFHYFRCPKELWPERFQTIKNAGFNCVETYAAWNWSEREMPASVEDLSKIDVHDLDDWLTMAEQFGFYVIVRPGPYICAEWDGGGYPQWLVAEKLGLVAQRRSGLPRLEQALVRRRPPRRRQAPDHAQAARSAGRGPGANRE